jgi:hypothetical protein
LEGDVVSAPASTTESAPAPAAVPAAAGYPPPDGIRRRRRPGFFPYGFALALVLIAIFGINIACGDMFGLAYVLLCLPLAGLTTGFLLLWVLYIVIVLAVREANQTPTPMRRRVFIAPVLCLGMYVSLFLGLVSAARAEQMSTGQGLSQAWKRNPPPLSSIERPRRYPSPDKTTPPSEKERTPGTQEYALELDNRPTPRMAVPQIIPKTAPVIPKTALAPVPTPWREYHVVLTMQTGVLIEGSVLAETDDTIKLRLNNGQEATYKKRIFKNY